MTWKFLSCKLRKLTIFFLTWLHAINMTTETKEPLHDGVRDPSFPIGLHPWHPAPTPDFTIIAERVERVDGSTNTRAGSTNTNTGSRPDQGKRKVSNICVWETLMIVIPVLLLVVVLFFFVWCAMGRRVH